MSRGSDAVGRRKVLVATFAAVLVLVPVAIAWACNPQAHVSLDRTSYQPGQSMTIYGSYFPGKASITVSYPGGSQTVTTSAGGGFTLSGIAVPSQPGNYSVSASRPTGGFAPASFSVASPQPSSGSPSQQAPQTQPADSGTPKSTAPSYRAPSTTRSQRAGTVKQQSDPSPPQQQQRTTTAAPPAAAQPVFRGSAAPAPAAQTYTASDPVAAAAPARRGERAARSRGEGRRAPAAVTPSQQTAISDVWSGFEPGRTPSLTTAAGAPQGGTGSALAWGIGLLAVGLFGLVGGLAVAEGRRRRVA